MRNQIRTKKNRVDFDLPKSILTYPNGHPNTLEKYYVPIDNNPLIPLRVS